MGAVLRDYLGNTIPPGGWITDLTETEGSITVAHTIPTSGKEILQALGLLNRRFSIDGIVTGSVGAALIRTCKQHTGSISLTDDIGQNTLPVVQVFYTNSELKDVAGRPFEKKFTIQAIEVK